MKVKKLLQIPPGTLISQIGDRVEVQFHTPQQAEAFVDWFRYLDAMTQPESMEVTPIKLQAKDLQ